MEASTSGLQSLIHRPWFIALLLGLFYLIVNLFALTSYGPSWDEPLHRSWAILIWQYLQSGDVSLLEKLGGGGQYYGPVFYLMNLAVSNTVYSAMDIPFTAANHLLNVITAAAGVSATYLVAQSLFHRRVALFSAVMLMLFPMFIGHSHYNPKDIPLLTAFTFSVWLLFRTIRRPTFGRVIAAGIVCGIAFSLKITALFLIPIFVIALLAERQMKMFSSVANRSTARFIAIFIGITMLTAYIIWPTAWENPTLIVESIGYFLSGSFWSGNVLYFGEMLKAGDLPWHYSLVHTFMATPVPMIILALVGIIISLLMAWKGMRRMQTVLALAWLILPILYSFKPGFARYDGMRQFLFLIPALTTLAAAGLDHLLSWITRWKNGLRIGALASAVLFGYLIIQVLSAHPYEGSYVNEAMQIAYPSHLEEQFEIEYWGVAYKSGMDWLYEHAPAESTVCVPLTAQLITWYVPWREDIGFGCNERSDYLMFFTRFSHLPEELRSLEGEPIFTVNRFGADLLKIYELR